MKALHGVGAMSTMPRVCWGLALGLVSSLVLAAEPRIGKMVAYELPEYTIYTTRSGAQARTYANELAKFRATLEKLLGKRAVNSHMPTHLVILGRSAWEKYLQPRQNIAGWFQPGRWRGRKSRGWGGSRPRMFLN